MLGDDADDMEAIGDDLSFGKVGGNQAAIGTGEINANPHLLSALESGQKRAQSTWTAPGHDIEDAVVLRSQKVVATRCPL